MNIIYALRKLSRKQPFPPCQYCARDCKDDNVTYCYEFASRAALRARRG